MMLHPLNFEKYLRQYSSYYKLNEIPLDPIATSLLFDAFHKFALVGGMPEIDSITALDKTSMIYVQILKPLFKPIKRYLKIC
jgi:hypothetical protein